MWNDTVAELMNGGLDLAGAPLLVSAWQNIYFDPSMPSFAAELPSYGTPVSTPPVALGGRAVVGRSLEADPVTLAELPEGESLQVLVIYRADTDRLVIAIDQRADLAPLYLAGNGGPVTVTWGGYNGRVVISL
jgi:hypothetical protein